MHAGHGTIHVCRRGHVESVLVDAQSAWNMLHRKNRVHTLRAHHEGIVGSRLSILARVVKRGALKKRISGIYDLQGKHEPGRRWRLNVAPAMGMDGPAMGMADGPVASPRHHPEASGSIVHFPEHHLCE